MENLWKGTPRPSSKKLRKPRGSSDYHVKRVEFKMEDEHTQNWFSLQNVYSSNKSLIGKIRESIIRCLESVSTFSEELKASRKTELARQLRKSIRNSLKQLYLGYSGQTHPRQGLIFEERRDPRFKIRRIELTDVYDSRYNSKVARSQA